MAVAQEGPKATEYTVHDVEDQPPAPRSVSDSGSIISDHQIVSQHERQSLVRGLSQRHIQMIAIAGAIVCRSFSLPPPIPLPALWIVFLGFAGCGLRDAIRIADILELRWSAH